jgi:mannose-6-phosphate isomerase-like protein (cupin superfamily)
MAKARHEMPSDIAALSLEEIAERYVARFRDKTADWAAFEDAKIEGYRRAQHRFIGAGGSGKHDDPSTIPPRGFTLSIVFVPPGQGNAAHTHEVEEVFFVLQGYLTVFIEDETGRRVSRKLGPWECIACPPGVIHGFQNDSLEPVYMQVMLVYMQVMLGRGRPEAMGYTDDDLYRRREAHLA